ncbi:hypothetical protein RIU76_11275 [Latilactobacillus sakei subsp. sakei]|uniref:hypothetical protein n=1 Tax=Latilactobacillus sakei TaxID=1599 RepID=UPI00285A09B5|nr:hypothetical protein [Latilactobacillus sakei]MDR7925265.1 hypothetical protein [Latilactobacillus sakei subsp. sakei]
MNTQDILSSYLIGIYLGTTGAIILSLIQVLPIKDSFGTIVLGFKNPNTIGYYFAMIAMIQIMIKKGNYKILNFIVYITAIYFNIKFFGNETAIMMMLLFILVYILFNYMRIFDKNWIITLCLGALPFILFFIALYLGNNYGEYNYIEKINKIVTSRPVIWHYYLTNYPLSLFGNDVQIYTNGLAYTVGQGAFDGAYIYFPILNGILPFIIALFGLSISNVYLYKSRNFILLTLFIVLEISGFSEIYYFHFISLQ